MLKKGVIAWIATGLVFNITAFVFTRIIFPWIYSIEPTYVFRAPAIYTDAEWITLMGAYGFLFSAMFLLVYALIYRKIAATSYMKGITYGFFMWLDLLA